MEGAAGDRGIREGAGARQYDVAEVEGEGGKRKERKGGDGGERGEGAGEEAPGQALRLEEIGLRLPPVPVPSPEGGGQGGHPFRARAVRSPAGDGKVHRAGFLYRPGRFRDRRRRRVS